jgi:eukaryotic-like serine/threonine-protein kinase
VSSFSRSMFEQCALASGLLTSEQIEEVRKALAPGPGAGPEAAMPDPDQQLAHGLVARGWLNIWQAKQLLEGRSKFNLGPYRIVDSIGRGGMGQVFMAEHQLLRNTVAVKVLPRDKSTPEAIANFAREIQTQAKLQHPKLVRALDEGKDGNVYFLVTEYVPGSDLRKLVRRNGPLDMKAAASIIAQVAAGLQHAHDQGFVHRDVKPGNVLVTPEGEAKLSDLGLAGPIGAGVEDDPRFGKIAGTADYLSPDHILNPTTPTPAWDIYSLGCTLYYAVTGKVPFPGGTAADKARAHCDLRPLDPRRLNHSLTEAFVEVLADMMAKDPAQRIPSGNDVIRRLAPWTQSLSATVEMETIAAATPAGDANAAESAPPPINLSSDYVVPPGYTVTNEHKHAVKPPSEGVGLLIFLVLAPVSLAALVVLVGLLWKMFFGG